MYVTSVIIHANITRKSIMIIYVCKGLKLSVSFYSFMGTTKSPRSTEVPNSSKFPNKSPVEWKSLKHGHA